MAYSLVLVLLFVLAFVLVVKSGSIFSPAKLIMMMLAYLYFTDFAIRGTDDRFTSYMSAEEVELWAAFILAYVTSLMALVALLGSIKSFRPGPGKIEIKDLPDKLKYKVSIGMIAVIISNWTYRIILSKSLSDFWADMLAPRGQAIWLVVRSEWASGYEIGTVFDLATPIATGWLLHVVLRARPRHVPLPLIFMVLGLILMLANGSRTDLIEAFFIGVIYSILTRRRRNARLITSGVVLALMVLFVTAYRAEGIGRFFTESGVELEYQQDDNFYETIHVLATSESDGRRWDATKFLLTCLVNPIPRSIWPGKPFLDQSFFDPYKDFWETITSLGELTACYGAASAVILNSLLVGLLFVFISAKYRKAKNIFDLFVYISAVLWSFMILRSLLNITQAMYPYIAAELLRITFNHKQIWTDAFCNRMKAIQA